MGVAPTVDPKPRRLFRGRRILLLIASALAVYTVVTFTVGDLLDSGREKRGAEQAANDARQWHAAWSKYGREDDDALETAEQLLGERRWVESDAEFRAVAERRRADFQAERDELLRRLTRDVFVPWQADLKDRFPFNPAADECAPVEIVEMIFNPQSGVYWRIAEKLDRLASVEINGLRAAPAPDEYTRTLPAAKRLRDVLFNGTDKVNVMFTVRMTGASAALEMGGQFANSGPRLCMLWQGEGARLALAMNKAVVEDGTPWGLLRLLWGMQDSGDAYEWSAGDHRVNIEISPREPFERELYTAFAP